MLHKNKTKLCNFSNKEKTLKQPNNYFKNISINGNTEIENIFFVINFCHLLV